MAIINSTAEPYLATDLISDNHSVSAGVAGVAVAPVRPLFFIFFAYLDYFILLVVLSAPRSLSSVAAHRPLRRRCRQLDITMAPSAIPRATPRRLQRNTGEYVSIWSG